MSFQGDFSHSYQYTLNLFESWDREEDKNTKVVQFVNQCLGYPRDFIEDILFKTLKLLYLIIVVGPLTEIVKPSKLAAKCRSSISRISANFEFVTSKNALIGQHAFFSKLPTNVANASAGATNIDACNS